MRYLGIDYGSARVGIAVSNEEGTIAFPRDVFQNDRELVARIAEIVEGERIGAIVVGDTKTVSGSDNPITSDAKEFIEALRAKIPVPIETMWEAWSSVEAGRYIPDKRDDAAAAIILQRFLDMRKTGVQ